MSSDHYLPDFPTETITTLQENITPLVEAMILDRPSGRESHAAFEEVCPLGVLKDSPKMKRLHHAYVDELHDAILLAIEVTAVATLRMADKAGCQGCQDAHTGEFQDSAG